MPILEPGLVKANSYTIMKSTAKVTDRKIRQTCLTYEMVK